ncbi:MAG: molecular chaperone DnaJ [Parvularculaceae bacterium]
MAKACYYETLGLERGVGGDAVKAAFRKMAMQFHPDRNPGDADAERKFKEVNEAYEVLKDPDKRAAYDRFGHAAFQNGAGGAGGPGFNGFARDFGASFSDIFDDIFGEFTGARGGRGRGRGADLRYNLTISLEEAFAGKKATIEVPGAVACEVCSGSGARPGSQPSACATCGGHGKVRATQGFFTIERSCPSCHGAGSVVTDPCTACDGAGRVERERRLRVDIPAGVENGARIRLLGEGEPGRNGGPAGDLYVFVSVRDHDLFEREGADLYCRAPISMATAALGGEIEAPTIDGGRVKIKIPAGAQTGKQFRLRDRGMPILRRQERGDLYVELFVETPTKLNARQKELLKEFCEAGGGECPQTQGFFDRAKAFWDRVKDAADAAKPN